MLRPLHSSITCQLRRSPLPALLPIISRRFLCSTASLCTNDLSSTSNTPDSSTSPVENGGGGKSLLEHLKERGLVESVTGLPGSLDHFLRHNKTTVYAGVDPTAPSLHVGHLLPLMNLLHFYLNGHTSIALVGKATAIVGDPSGRTTERTKSALSTTLTNTSSLISQLTTFFTRAESYAISRGYSKSSFGTHILRTNGEWLDNLNLVEFLSGVGRVVRVNQMLSRQSVKSRMASEKGISFAEFTYQLLQSYDFWWLWREEGCRVQIGGNDQYGNITAGIDLISRLSSPELPSSSPDTPSSESPPDLAYGLTTPLLTTSTGTKLGKSTNASIWLSSSLTSSFSLHQYFLRLPDSLLPQLLPALTLLPSPTIKEVLVEHERNPEKRRAQRVLADEVVSLVHGEKNRERCGVMGEVLFPPAEDGLEGVGEVGVGKECSADQIIDAFTGDSRMVALARSEVLGELVTKVAALAGAVRTRSEGEQLVRQGGLYIGGGGGGGRGRGWRVERGERVREEWLIEGRVLLVRVGKGGVCVVRVEE
ncbi:hypothetical protein EV426DRAFT_558039 [Tirmania nivea]|nr:hypothetical protein EV426DRAFT_558039 [Tirmania nivea]